MLEATKFLMKMVGLMPEECAQMPRYCWVKNCCAVVTASVRFILPCIDSAGYDNDLDKLR